jgi:hypothetical protein
MIRRIAVALLLLCLAGFGQLNLAGTYKGKWAGATANGEFTVRLEQNAGAWKATVQFTLGGADVPTTMNMLRVDGSTIEMKYDFDLGGNKLQSHLTGEIKEGQFSAKYKTTALADDSAVDEGTCEAKRQE